MKPVLLVFTLLLSINSLFGQTLDNYLEVARGVLNDEKEVAVAEVMMLTEEEKTPFWELYNEYNAASYKIHDKRIELIKDFAENYETLTDEKADELWTGVQAYKLEHLKLNKTYYKKLKKILPAGKAALYFQIENKIKSLIDAELALELPLLETN